MAPRMSLQTKLVDILNSNNVYFQPPPEFKMSYPCIVYHFAKFESDSADNLPYVIDNKYEITVIDSNPDSGIPKKIAQLPGCSNDRTFKTSNLNHFVFTIIF
jgi:hypothetical protein